MSKLNVAVLFGGPSQEHDVSVVSAQQLMDAADVRKFNVIPVYMSFDGAFYHGQHLRSLERFKPKPPGLREVQFAWGDLGPELRSPSGKWRQNIDCVLPVCHGPFGEDGRIQGLLETLGIPVTGFSSINAAIAMRKDVTKSTVKSAGVHVLPHITVNVAELRDPEAICARVEKDIKFPAIVKPAHLGSSIGVGLAKNRDELLVHLQVALREDTVALVEPQVQNLEELNIAVRFVDGDIKFSAVEKPKTSAELLDFKEKYLASADQNSGGQGKLGNATVPSQGMLSLTRTINPDLPEALSEKLHDYAAKAFTVLGLRGAPRMDFMTNSETGELWFNEINPIPGSYGFFLWEGAQETVLFSELVEHLVKEAISSSLKTFDDPVPQGAYLLPR